MAVLRFEFLAGQPVLDVFLLGFILESRQSLLELTDILLLSRSALSLILTNTRQALDVLQRSQATTFMEYLGGLTILGGQRTFWLFSASIVRQS